MVRSSKDLATTPEHRIVISALETGGYKMMINVWTAAHGFNDARYALHGKIMHALQQSGIKLPGM